MGGGFVTIAFLLTAEALALFGVVVLMAWVVGKARADIVLTPDDCLALVRREYPDLNPDRILIAADHRGALLLDRDRIVYILLRFGMYWVVWVVPDPKLTAEERDLFEGGMPLALIETGQWDFFSGRLRQHPRGQQISLRTGHFAVPKLYLCFADAPTE